MRRQVKLAEEFRVAIAYAWHPAHGSIRIGAGLESVTVALSGALAVSWRSSLRMIIQDLYGWRDMVGQLFFCGFSEFIHCTDLAPAKKSENPESLVRFFLHWTTTVEIRAERPPLICKNQGHFVSFIGELLT